MFLEKINKLFDDTYLYDSDIEEDEEGREYIYIYEVSDNIENGFKYTTDSYINAIDKINILSCDFIKEYREYQKCEREEIHFYIIKNRYYINEDKDDIIEVVDEETLLYTEIKKG